MDTYSRLTTLYGNLYNRKGIPFWMLTPARRIVRSLANKKIPSFFAKEASTKPKQRSLCADRKVVVSLTSFPSRLEKLWLVIESLLRQTCPPDKIVLWLCTDEVSSLEEVPASVRKEQETGIFEIRFVPESFRSHLKYYHAFKEFPEDIVITVDDDIIYHPRTIECLLEEHLKHPDAIITNLAREVKYTNGQLSEYNSWPQLNGYLDSEEVFLLGYGGVLYSTPPLCPEVLNWQAFTSVCKLADDVWLNAIARIKGIKVICNSSQIIFIEIKNNNTVRLKYKNVGSSMNDQQIVAVDTYCKQTFGRSVFDIHNRQ